MTIFQKKNLSSVYSISDRRRQTREVAVGNVMVGGKNPIRIQSMTSTPTSDVEKTVEQTIQLVDKGCEIVRFTVQGIKESSACEKIKDLLIQKGYDVPLVADIHFFPAAALHVADFVEKIRINPGNFVDKRNLFTKINEKFDERRHERDIERIQTKLVPLIDKCKKYNRSVRIGVNHGSLSERIMQRYGDTVEGMVASALEFTSVFRQFDFHNLIYSMKSSNPKVMIDAYRLLVEEIDKKGWNYPLHLGVTEAGAELPGRVKSSVGIGTLLAEGLGDTIRVSLTESPINEIDPCRSLIRFSEQYHVFPDLKEQRPKVGESYHRSFSKYSLACSLEECDLENENLLVELGFSKKKILSPQTPDIVFIKPDLMAHPSIKVLQQTGLTVLARNNELISEERGTIEHISEDYLIFNPYFPYIDNAFNFLYQLDASTKKVIVKINYDKQKDEDVIIRAAAEFGALLNENLCSCIFPDTPSLSLKDRRLLGLTILQATRKRLFETDFISCPSCGRTLFDIEEVTQRIRQKTNHLTGLKIAVMGCIVNGPGEMADADFGFVGSKPGKVDLYVKHTCVVQNINMEDADTALIDLIKEHGLWHEANEDADDNS